MMFIAVIGTLTLATSVAVATTDRSPADRRVPDAVRLCIAFPPEEDPPYFRAEFESAAVVFIGKVVELDRVTVRLEAREFWKGEPTKTITMLTGLPPDPNVWVEDVFYFSKDTEYLVFAYSDKAGQLSTGACTRTRTLSTARDEIRSLDKIARRKVVK